MNTTPHVRPARAVRRRRLAVAACLGALVPAGCRSYDPKPLNPVDMRESLLSRSASDESVRQFAARLAQDEHPGDPATFDPADGLTLAEAEPVALVFNRDLRLARLSLGVARARAENAGRWEDPVAGIDVERIISGVPDPWVVAGTIGLTIPISGRLGAEEARASAAHKTELRRLGAKEWATRSALRELWIEWSAQAHRNRATEDLLVRLRAIADLAQRQELAGVMSRIDARLFRVELADSEAQLIAARSRAAELELQLRDLLGLAPAAPVTLVESITFTPRAGASGWSLGEIETGNAELAAVRSEYEVAEHSLRVEIRKQYPDLSIGPGFGTDQGDERVLVGIRLPIPLWNGNRQGIAEADAEREAARGRVESTYEHLASRLSIARTRYDAGRAMREAVETLVLPLADEQDADVRRVAELGRVDPLLLLQSIKAQHEAKVRLIDARAAESTGAIRLDELIGPPASTASESTAEGGRP